MRACKTSLQRFRNFSGEKLSVIPNSYKYNPSLYRTTTTTIIVVIIIISKIRYHLYLWANTKNICVCSVVNLVHEYKWNMFVNASTRTDNRTHAQTLKLKLIHSHVQIDIYTAICNDHCITSIDKIHINRCIYCVSFCSCLLLCLFCPALPFDFSHSAVCVCVPLSCIFISEIYTIGSLLYMAKNVEHTPAPSPSPTYHGL